MGILTDILAGLLSWRRAKAVDRRATAISLADQLDALADLMSDVLKVTAADGRIQLDKLPELEVLRKRVWNRWVTILGTSGYASQDMELQAQIEKCIQIAHAAPGAYVEEVYLAQIAISEGQVSKKVRERFAVSIDKIRDLTAAMRLNA